MKKIKRIMKRSIQLIQNMNHKMPKLKWLLLAILVIIIVLPIGMKLLSKKTVTKEYLEGFYQYDEERPIPMKTDDSYYYLNPKTGKKLSDETYQSASEYEGEFAVVRQDDKQFIINRKGKMVKELQDDDTVNFYPVYHLIEISGTLYNDDWKQLTKDSQTVTYQKNGYSTYIDETAMELGIINSEGTVIYQTDYDNSDATITLDIPDVHQSLENDYAIIKLSETKQAGIINLKTKEWIIPLDNKEITSNGNNLFTISNRDSLEEEREIYIEDNGIAYEKEGNSSLSFYTISPKVLQFYDKDSFNYHYYSLKDKKEVEIDAKTYADTNSIELVSNYQKYSCNGMVGITKNGEEYIPCEYRKITFLDSSLYSYLKEKTGREYAILETEDKTLIYNLKNKKVIKEIPMRNLNINQTAIYLSYETESGKKVFNFLTGKEETFKLEDTLLFYTNYMLRRTEGEIIYYNNNFKEIAKI